MKITLVLPVKTVARGAAAKWAPPASGGKWHSRKMGTPLSGGKRDKVDKVGMAGKEGKASKAGEAGKSDGVAISTRAYQSLFTPWADTGGRLDSISKTPPNKR